MDNNISDIDSDELYGMDEDEIILCQDLKDNLEEISFDNKDEQKQEIKSLENKNNIEEVQEILVDINNNQEKDINELMKEIDELKKIASKKDNEVKNLKNQYKEMYSNLNL